MKKVVPGNNKNELENEPKQVLEEIAIDQEVSQEVNKVQTKTKTNEYYFEFNITLSDKKIMNVSYIIEDINKQSAKQKAENKLASKYSNIVSHKLITAKKKNFKDKEKEDFIGILPSDYEVKFRINIDGIKYDKCFIISTNDQNKISSLLKKRCKKEFKNYRSLTNINYKLASINSEEYSIKIDEVISKTIEKEEKLNEDLNKKVNVITTPDIPYFNNLINDHIDNVRKVDPALLSRSQFRKLKNVLGEMPSVEPISIKLTNESIEDVENALAYTNVTHKIKKPINNKIKNTIKENNYLLGYDNNNNLISISPQICVLDKDYNDYLEFTCMIVYKNNEVSHALNIKANHFLKVITTIRDISDQNKSENLKLDYLDKNALVCVVRNNNTNKIVVYGARVLVDDIKIVKRSKYE